MADAVVRVKWLTDTSDIRRAEAEYKKSVSFLTSYQIAEDQKRIRSSESAGKKVRADISSIADSHKKAQDAITRATQQSARMHEMLSQKTTKVLIADYVTLQNKKKNVNLAIEREYDRHTRAVLQADRKLIDQQLREYKQAALKRGDVLHKGAGTQAGILGVGRNVVGGLGLLKASAVGGIVTMGVSALKTLHSHAKEADDAIDNVDIALGRVGVTNQGVRDGMLAGGRVIADEFAKRTVEVNRLQALVTGYGGQIGETNKRIVELALANEAALGVPAENLAKMFAKASDPENEASLAKLGLTFKKGATEAERWAAINERFGKSVDTAKKSTQDGVGDMQRSMNKMDDTIARLSNSLINVLGPAITGIGNMILGLLKPIELAIKGLDDLFAKSEEQKKRQAAFKQERQDAFAGINTSDDLFEYIKKYKGGQGMDPEVTRILSKGGISSDMLAESINNPEGFRQRAGAILDKIASNIQLSRSASRQNEIDAKNTVNIVDVAQKNLNVLLKMKDKMPAGLFEMQKAEYLAQGAKMPELITGGSSGRVIKRKAEIEVKLIPVPKGSNVLADMLFLSSQNGRPIEPEPIEIRAPYRGREMSLTDLLGQEQSDKEQQQAQKDAALEKTEEQFNSIREAVNPATDAVSAFVSELIAGGNAAKAMANTFIAGVTSMAAALAGKLALFAIFSLLTGGQGAVFDFAKGALGFSQGGIVPQYYAGGTNNVVDTGGKNAVNIDKFFRPKGTDTVPAMLTPGEGVLKKSAMQAIGKNLFKILNSLGDNPPESIRMGGFINRAGQGSPSIRMGGFINGTDRDSMGNSLLGWNPQSTTPYVNQDTTSIRMGGFINVLGGAIEQLTAQVKALSSRQTIVVDSYGMRVGQAKAGYENTFGVI